MPTTSLGRRRLRRAAAIAATCVTVAGLTLAGATTAQAAARVSFTGSVPSWATKANLVAPAATNTMYQGELFLSMQDRQGAIDKATAVSTPGSPSYRQYVSPADWIATYAPTQQVLDDEVAYLKSKNITNISYPASRLYVTFRGTAAQLQSLFQTPLATYDVDGTKVVGPSGTPSLPADVARGVSGISIDQARLLTRPKTVTQAGAGTKALSSASSLLAPRAVQVKTPCSAYTNQVWVTIPSAYGSTRAGTANCGYSPAQLRSAYKMSAKATDGSAAGSGQTVAIVDAYASPTMASDLNTWARNAGEPTFSAGQYTDISPSKSTFADKAACQNPSGWQGEQALDVEAVRALAPGASIVYSGGTDCGAGLDIALSKILDGNTGSGTVGTAPLANIVSNSYGGTGEPDTTDAYTASYVQGEENIQLQAIAEGVGLYFASGDAGDEYENTGVKSPDFPASSPYVTAVGGTSLGISKTGTKVYETSWGDQLDEIVPGTKKGTKRFSERLPGSIFAGGGGGGKSAIYARPSYQSGAVVPGSLGAGKRLIPDISALADPYTGFKIGLRPITNNTTLATGSYTTGVSGGTSLSTPLVAAQIAVAQQKTGAVVGFANPVLYSLAATAPSTFTDVVTRAAPASVAYSSSNASYLVTLGHDSSLATSRGYDTATGLGSLTMANIGNLATPKG